MPRRTNKIKKLNKRRKRFSKKGGAMTTSVDSDPYSYRENEYKEMNELLLKGGQDTNTPDSQGQMTLDELNISNIGSENNTNDQLDDSYMSGYAQDPDEGLMDTYNNFLQQQNLNQQNDWYDEGDTDLDSFLSQQSSQQSSFPEFSQSTIASDITTGGKQKYKKRIRKTKKNKNLTKRKRTNKNR